jgi:hypothetical protein
MPFFKNEINLYRCIHFKEMADADTVLQGILIGAFTCIGLSALSYCIRKRMKNRTMMKQSSSMEDLTSVDTTDPQQDEV